MLHRDSGRQDMLCPSTRHLTGQTLQVRLARFNLTGCSYQQHQHKLWHWTTPLVCFPPACHNSQTASLSSLETSNSCLASTLPGSHLRASSTHCSALLKPSSSAPAPCRASLPRQLWTAQIQRPKQGLTQHQSKMLCRGSLSCGHFKIDQSSAGPWHRTKNMELQHFGIHSINVQWCLKPEQGNPPQRPVPLQPHHSFCSATLLL